MTTEELVYAGTTTANINVLFKVVKVGSIAIGIGGLVTIIITAIGG